MSVVSQLSIAQPYGQITGKIVDGRTGEPLGGAVVNIISTTLGAVADPKGTFLIDHIPPGVYSIHGNMLGYDIDSVHSLTVSQNAIDTINFKLYALGMGKLLKILQMERCRYVNWVLPFVLCLKKSRTS